MSECPSGYYYWPGDPIARPVEPVHVELPFDPSKPIITRYAKKLMRLGIVEGNGPAQTIADFAKEEDAKVPEV